MFGRKFPILLAQQLNTNASLVKSVCNSISKNFKDFKLAIAGKEIPSSSKNIFEGGAKVKNKTNLRIIWKDGSFSNFRLKCFSPSQIHLELACNMVSEFEAQYHQKIPQNVKDALLLFTGKHPNQKSILDSIPVDFVGTRIRTEVERKYNNRLTLASMYGYDETMAMSLMNWLRKNIANLFEFCFSIGASSDCSQKVDYLWYYCDEKDFFKFQIYDLQGLTKNLRMMTKKEIAPLVTPRDAARVGSTINLPFGNLQFHEDALQFRHDPLKLSEIFKHRRNCFGSKPKQSGHENELLIANALNNDKHFRAHFCERIGRPILDFSRANAGGKNASFENGVLGRKTTGKTDISVTWKDGSTTNISVKKSVSGQAYLVSAKNFVSVYEAQYKVIVPEKVVRALELFIGEACDSKDILERTNIQIDGVAVRKLEHEQNHRLVYDVIYAYDSNIATELLKWLKKEIVSVFEISFSAGAVADKKYWSNILWYKNLVDQDCEGIDYMIPMTKIMDALRKRGERNIVERGPKNGGSTISLPFGHLQYHLKQLEFYHKMKKIQDLLS